MNLSKHAFFFFFLICLQRTSFAQNFSPQNSLNRHESGITVLIKDPLSHLLIAGDLKGEIYIYDLTDDHLLKKIDAHQSAIGNLVFNSTGNLLLSSTHDGEIKIYDFKHEKIIQSIYSPNYSGIYFVLFSIADGFIYFNGNNHLFKTRSDLTQPVNELFVDQDTIFDAVITKDRSALIYCCGNSIKVLNTRNDRISQSIQFGSANIERIALVNDTIIATWSADGTFAMWNYKLNQLSLPFIFSMKAGNPSAMSFSSTGRMMCSGNTGNWARIWIPLEKQITQELFLHKEIVSSSVFGLTDDDLYTGSLDKSIIHWKKGTNLPPFVIKPPKQLLSEQDSIKSPHTTDVEMLQENIPSVINGRKVISTDKIVLTNSTIKIYVYDNSYIDGDTMSLFFNGKWILDHYGVTKQKKEITINLIENTNNYLVLFANNLGKSPPNTAAIEFVDGNKKYFYKLSSNLKACSAINFYYKK